MSRRRSPISGEPSGFHVICTDRGQHPTELLQILLVSRTEITQELGDVMHRLNPDGRPGFNMPPVGVLYTVMRTERSRRRVQLPDPQVGPDHIGARTWRFRCTHPGCPRDVRFTEQRLGATCWRVQEADPDRSRYRVDVSFAG